MGSRFAVSTESPLAQTTKDAIANSSEADTIYGSNFDGINARVLKTPAAEKLMAARPAWTTIVYRAFEAAKEMNIPLWKVIPGLITQFDKIFMIAQFGAATKAIQAATVDGDVDGGVQFVGQSQGMIKTIESVDDIVQQILHETRDTSVQRAKLFLGSDSGR